MASPALVVVLLTVPSLAQRHGASRGFSGHSGPASHGSFAGHGSMIHGGPSFSRGARFGGNFRSGHRSSFFSPRHFRRFNRPRFFYGVSPWFNYGFPGYYGYPYYGDYDYSSPQAYPADDNSSAYNNQSGDAQAERDARQNQVDRLEDEVARLRNEKEPVNSSAQGRPEIHASTVLIFRDHHTRDVQNYAIVVETLWVFDAQKAMKYPIDSLDVPATTKANDDRGIDFRLPESQ
jgi:hypothetical protein